MPAADAERRRVAELLGREPQGDFDVVVRDATGDPVVIRNQPLLRDGTPMPTLYWLVGYEARRAVDRLEASGGVRAAERSLAPEVLSRAHQAYAAERESRLPPGWSGQRPSGGVGGTRQGVKCLHAHYAWYLAGGDDPVGRWVDEQLTPAAVTGGAGDGGDARVAAVAAVAAVDCGTNSTRLLVADRRGRTLERLMRITRLGEGVDDTRQLAPAAIHRTVRVLAEFREVMDHYHVGRVRMTSTSAARDASNRERFFSEAEAAVGVRPELLGGDQEGVLSFVGATAGLDSESGPWLIADIGGGSTELARGHVGGQLPDVVRSLDIGCVRLTERFHLEEPHTAAELRAARRHVADLLSQLTRDEPRFGGAVTFLGLAGTVAALAAIEQGLETYDRDRVHHYSLSRASVEGMLAELAAETPGERRRRAGVEPDRADVIVGGTVVLAEIMRHFGFDICLTSESDILDGLVFSLLPEPIT